MRRFAATIVVAYQFAGIFYSSVSLAQPNPAEDGWQTEALSSAAQDRLIQLTSEYLGLLPAGESILAENAQCGLLREELFSVRRKDTLLSCRQLDASESPLVADSPFATGFSQLLKPLLGESVSGVRFRLKITRVEMHEDHVRTRALLFATGRTPEGSVQVNSTWQTHWVLSDSKSVPLLKSVDVLAHEVTHLYSSKPWFTDATAALFGNDRVFQSQVLQGMPEWLNRIERYAGLSIYSRNGIAVGDANGDGLDDVYLCQPGGLPNRLFLQKPDATVVDHSSSSKVDWLNDTRSALFVDVDNDGNQDLVVATFQGVYVCRNLGEGIFDLAYELPSVGRDVSSLSAVDYDDDGFLDLHVCVYNSERQLQGLDQQNVYDSTAIGGMNRLYRNLLGESNGQWLFEDATVQAGMGVGNARFSFAAAWEDFDSDGDQDLYIANDFGFNCLYRNDGGQFKEVSAEYAVDDYGPGMSVAWGDYNRDGHPDLYVANMFSAAGNRVTRQQQFKAAAEGTSRESFQRFNKGNSLYTFNGESFEEVPGAAGAENALWAWSSLLADIDNDGWQDALVANGYITGPGGGDL